MKTISKTIGILILSALFVSCSDGGVGPVEVAPHKSFQAEAHVFQTIKEAQGSEGVFLQYTGGGNSSLLDNFSLDLSHMQLQDGDVLTIYDGNFSIRNEEGDVMSGVYVGRGFEGEEIEIELDFQITSQNGLYQNVQHNLVTILRDRKKGGSMEVDITGRIE